MLMVLLVLSLLRASSSRVLRFQDLDEALRGMEGCEGGALQSLQWCCGEEWGQGGNTACWEGGKTYQECCGVKTRFLFLHEMGSTLGNLLISLSEAFYLAKETGRALCLPQLQSSELDFAQLSEATGVHVILLDTYPYGSMCGSESWHRSLNVLNFPGGGRAGPFRARFVANPNLMDEETQEEAEGWEKQEEFLHYAHRKKLRIHGGRWVASYPPSRVLKLLDEGVMRTHSPPSSALLGTYPDSEEAFSLPPYARRRGEALNTSFLNLGPEGALRWAERFEFSPVNLLLAKFQFRRFGEASLLHPTVQTLRCVHIRELFFSVDWPNHFSFFRSFFSNLRFSDRVLRKVNAVFKTELNCSAAEITLSNNASGKREGEMEPTCVGLLAIHIREEFLKDYPAEMTTSFIHSVLGKYGSNRIRRIFLMTDAQQREANPHIVGIMREFSHLHPFFAPASASSISVSVDASIALHSQVFLGVDASTLSQVVAWGRRLRGVGEREKEGGPSLWLPTEVPEYLDHTFWPHHEMFYTYQVFIEFFEKLLRKIHNVKTRFETSNNFKNGSNSSFKQAEPESRCVLKVFDRKKNFQGKVQVLVTFSIREIFEKFGKVWNASEFPTEVEVESFLRPPFRPAASSEIPSSFLPLLSLVVGSAQASFADSFWHGCPSFAPLLHLLYILISEVKEQRTAGREEYTLGGWSVAFFIQRFWYSFYLGKMRKVEDVCGNYEKCKLFEVLVRSMLAVLETVWGEKVTTNAGKSSEMVLPHFLRIGRKISSEEPRYLLEAF